MPVEMAGASDKGLVRERNEDAIKMIPEQGIAILSDGMGGHLAGNVASRMAVEVIAEELAKGRIDPNGSLPDSARDLVVASVSAANDAIRAVARSRPECQGMGATVAMCLVSDRVLVSSLGDSRVYRFADDELTQVTEDHTLAQRYLREGVISKREARVWPGRNLLIKGLGIEPSVDPDIRIDGAARGEIYLLCSDGLTEVVSDEAIAETLRDAASGSLQSAVESLIEMANAGGGPDNISVIMIKTGSGGV
jgi:protein phosphatase